MTERTSLRHTALYVFIVAIAFLVFLLLGGKRWMTTPSYNPENNPMEMHANP
ncbi:MAG: hypothetical protein RBS23_00205 [Mariniphaga sp.]|jgi:hypothetical protein|nr:hypothetical protein [Mariniphaga sp.]